MGENYSCHRADQDQNALVVLKRDGRKESYIFQYG